jgi:hypothetical protein
MERSLEGKIKRAPSGMGSLYLRGAIGALVAAVLMAVLTANVCRIYLNATHAGSPMTPALLFGAV